MTPNKELELRILAAVAKVPEGTAHDKAIGKLILDSLFALLAVARIDCSAVMRRKLAGEEIDRLERDLFKLTKPKQEPTT